MNGFSISLVALFLGLCAHTLKQLVASRNTPGDSLTLHQYLSGSWAETGIAVATAIGLFLIYPEIGNIIPMSAKFHWPVTQSPLGGFVCGYFGNSLADVLGTRITKVVSG